MVEAQFLDCLSNFQQFVQLFPGDTIAWLQHLFLWGTVCMLGKKKQVAYAKRKANHGNSA
jgi:hypothetical protein